MTYPHGVRQETHPTFLHPNGIAVKGEPFVTDTQLELPSVETSIFELCALYEYVKSHDSTPEQPLPTPKQLEQIHINPTSGCWELPQNRRDHAADSTDNQSISKSQDSYGRLALKDIGRTHALAHRTLFIVMRGQIPENIVLDHLCENKKCCWHRHLDPVTQGDNIRRIHHAKRLRSGQAPLF